MQPFVRKWVLGVGGLFLCLHCLCLLFVCVFVGIGAASVFHPSSWGSVVSGYSEGQRWHHGRGVSHHCHLSISFSPSLHLCFHVFPSLSFVAGMWTLLNFPLGGWWGRQEGMRAVILFAAFICLTPFYPARGLWLSGPHGEKVAHVPLTSLVTASQQPAESTEVREQVRDKQVFPILHLAITALSFKTLRPCSSTLFVKPPQSIEIKKCALQLCFVRSSPEFVRVATSASFTELCL